MFSKVFQTTVITLASLILVVLLGCSTVLDAVTPCYIPEQLEYTGELWSPVPYTTLWDAERIARRTYFLLEELDIGITAAREFQHHLFNPTGPLGLLLVGGPAFGLGSLLISKPKDKKRITELEHNGNAGV